MPVTAMTPDSVDFINEDKAGRIFFTLFEHVAHAAGANAHEHLHEIGARDGEEWHVRLAGDRAGGQRLAGAGGANEQHAPRNAPAEPLKLLWVLQELHDLLQVFLGLVDAGHVVERHAAMRLRQQLRLGLAETHRPARAVLHLP